jgi:hypothetical protein
MSSHHVRGLCVAILGYAPPSPPDMIWPKGGVPPGGRYRNLAIEQVTTRADEAVLAEVRAALARGETRRWVCGVWRHENVYRFAKVHPRVVKRRATRGCERALPP